MKVCLLSIIICLSPITAVFAQYDIGVDYFMVGELDRAKEIFEKQKDINPAQSYYYLGEIAYAQGNFPLAKSWYEKGLAAEPTYVYNKIGMAKLALKDNPAEGVATLTSIAREKENRKDARLLVAIAKVYYDNGMFDEAEKMISAAEKADKNSPLISLFRGDAYKDAKDVGKAAAQYEQAILNDKQSAVAYIKIAQLYLKVNSAYAIEKLNALRMQHPDYLLTDKYMAKAYYHIGQYKNAIAAYETFFDKGHGIDDLTDYAASLFFTERFVEAAELINKGLRIDPDNFVLNRLAMYSALENKTTAEGLTVAHKFFSLPLKENEYIVRDYTTYGDLLLRNGNPEEAIVQYDKAIKISDNLSAVYKHVSDNLKSSYPSMAADYLEKYIETMGEQADAMDYYNLGQNLYRAATMAMKDTVDMEAPARLAVYLDRGDAAFAVVSERTPQSHLGPLFRARINALRDPETIHGLAKPYYEQALVVITSKEEPEKYRRELLEIYRYLSYFHYLQFEANKNPQDREQAIVYCNKTLELDPSNSVANQLLEALK